ncbi:MAG: DUF4912 domain-containing protein [Verrucomicrobiae bacterium]
MSKQAKKPGRAVKKSTGKSGPAPAALDNLGELPRSYGTDTIFLVAQDPHWLFTYWDIDISLHPGGKTFLKVFGTGEAVESEIEVPFETRNWYIPVKDAASEYTVEIGYYRGAQWKAIARSVTIRTPQDKMSESGEFHYATIPMHLSFQKLMENIQATMRVGETLIQALGRLQRDGSLHDPEAKGGLSPEDRMVFEALLGKEFLDAISGSSLTSEELSSRIQQRLGERLHSEGASELLSKVPLGPAESSLFSALSALAGSSSWSSETLSSWMAAALTSWTARPSWSQSGLAFPTQSWWGAAALSSWLQAAASSWAGAAAMSSGNLAAMSSWSQAVMSSWSHAETSSWGGSENLGSFGFARGEFFLHVNAEVIFYGGTHPQAKVTIDGKPVALAPDGTFRFHFVFPDGNHEIPIVATSPDGVETRSATLKLARATSRTGDVGHTAQPPLAAPMGAQV